MRIPTKSLLVILALALATLPGCLEEEDYGACAFAVDYDPECDVPEEEDGEGAPGGVNCVISQHPQCPDGICIRYQGSPAFCSLSCLVDDDCPGGGRCEEFAKGCDEAGENCDRYCVDPALVDQK
ncbi:MAG: hypothetical protein FJ098_10690 [Deltaproteobacteria bacterium]|nr:hypothetical protein [Deltaproteobacteria bacterium]